MHVSQVVLDNVANMLQKNFREMKVNIGNKHSFLGINFTIWNDKKIEVEMKDQIQGALDAFEESGDKPGCEEPTELQLIMMKILTQLKFLWIGGIASQPISRANR